MYIQCIFDILTIPAYKKQPAVNWQAVKKNPNINNEQNR